MPQLNPLDWGPQLIWLVITFGILYVLMKRIALPRIGGVIEARKARISGDLAEAERLHRETQEAIAAYEQALAEAKQKAHGIADQGRAKLKAEMAEERAKLDGELGAKAAEAEKRIEKARSFGAERRERGRGRRRDRSREAADRAHAEFRRGREGRHRGAEGLGHGIHLRAGILGCGLLLLVPRARALSRRA